MWHQKKPTRSSSPWDVRAASTAVPTSCRRDVSDSRGHCGWLCGRFIAWTCTRNWWGQFQYAREGLCSSVWCPCGVSVCCITVVLQSKYRNRQEWGGLRRKTVCMCLLNRKAGFSPLAVTIQKPFLGFAHLYGLYFQYHVNNECIVTAVYRITGEMAHELSGFISGCQVCSAPRVLSRAGSRAVPCDHTPHLPRAGDPHKSCPSPHPCSLTHAGQVPPQPGLCFRHKFSSLLWFLATVRCQLCSQPGLCLAALRRHKTWMFSSLSISNKSVSR